MKVYYRDNLLNDTRKSYTELINLPSINGVEIKGNITLDDLKIYNIDEIKKLIAATSVVYQVDKLPANPESNALYYVGTKLPYNIYMFLEDGTKLDLGISSTALYTTSIPIMADAEQRLSVNVDNDTIIINSEGKLQTTLDFKPGSHIMRDDAGVFNVVVDSETIGINFSNGVYFLEAKEFEPFTSEGDGKRGLVPDATENDAYSILGNDKKWHKIEPDFEPGEIKMWPVSTVPYGWLVCDGSTVSRTVYKDLFAAIGTTYGSGDGYNTFNLPNFTNRFIMGSKVANRGVTHGNSLPQVRLVFDNQNPRDGRTGVIWDSPSGVNPSGNSTVSMFTGGIEGSNMGPNYGYGKTDINFSWSNPMYNNYSTDRNAAIDVDRLNLLYIIKW